MSPEEVFSCGGCFGEIDAERECLFRASRDHLMARFSRKHICQVVDEFGDVSRNIDGIEFTIKKATLTLEKLK